MRWENPTNLPIVIDVTSPDDDNEMRQIDRFYSQMTAGKANVRGQDSIETIFTVTISDRWGNNTEPLWGVYKPMFEELIDKSHFSTFSVPGLPYDMQSGGYGIENLWNDV